MDNFADGGTIAGGGERGAREADQVSLLPAQSAYLLAAGVRRSAGVQRCLRPIELHATAVRLSRKVPGSLSLDSDDLHTTELVTDPRTKVSKDSISPSLFL